jgi:hypothetical protein
MIKTMIWKVQYQTDLSPNFDSGNEILPFLYQSNSFPESKFDLVKLVDYKLVGYNLVE